MLPTACRIDRWSMTVLINAPTCLLFDDGGTSAGTSAAHARRMPRKSSHEDGVKGKGRSKSDKARRSFELHGQYSSKHLRLKESAHETKCLQAREAR